VDIYKVPIGFSLGVIGMGLGSSVAASLLFPGTQKAQLLVGSVGGVGQHV
jgi:hypothetical protein